MSLIKREHIIALTCSILALSSCLEKVDTNIYSKYKSNLVIEGLVTDKTENQWVKISKSTSFTDSIASEPIDSAHVYLSDENGHSCRLRLVNGGLYIADSFPAQVGETYSLRVEYDGETYIASEPMNPCGTILTTETIYKEANMLVKKGYYIVLHARKPENQVNYYRVAITVNDSLYNNYQDILVFEDSFTNTEQELTIPYPFNLNDSVDIKVYSLSENTFQYFYKLSLLSSMLYTANSMIQNPPSNISGEALGCFEVSSEATLSLVIH